LQWKNCNTTLSNEKFDVNLQGFIVPQWRWVIGEEGLFFVFFFPVMCGKLKKGDVGDNVIGDHIMFHEGPFPSTYSTW
jgi:hypothetical protein